RARGAASQRLETAVSSRASDSEVRDPSWKRMRGKELGPGLRRDDHRCIVRRAIARPGIQVGAAWITRTWVPAYAGTTIVASRPASDSAARAPCWQRMRGKGLGPGPCRDDP